MRSNHAVTQPAEPSTCISDSVASSSRTNDDQKFRNNQPPPTSSYKPLETEIDKIQQEREQITKLHQEKVLNKNSPFICYIFMVAVIHDSDRVYM